MTDDGLALTDRAVRVLALGRAVAGALAVAAPRWPATILLGDEAAAPLPRLLTRLVGVRDIALGVATLGAVADRAERARQLVWLGVLCDTADAAFSMLEPDIAGRTRRAAVPMAGVSAAAGAWAARRLSGRVTSDPAAGVGKG